MEINLSKALNKSPQKIEEKILQCIFKRNDSLVDVIDIINPNMFTFADYGAIYSAMIDIYREGSLITAETVRLKLEDKGLIVESEIINKLYNEAYTSLKIKENALILKELSQRRYILENVRNLIEKQDTSPTTSENILEQVNDIAIKASEKMSYNEGATRCFSDVNKHMVDILDRLKNPKQEISYKTGWRVIDEQLGGLKGGSLICLGASSGAGKSWIALQTCLQMCCKKPDLKVLYFSLEMTKNELEQRMLSVDTEIPSQYLERPKMYFNRLNERGEFYNTYDKNPNNEEVLTFKQTVKNSLEKLNNFDITIDDEGGIKIDDVEARINRYALKNCGVDVIFIDHTYLLRDTNVSVNTSDEFGDIYYRLKNLAKKHNCVIFALHQLNFEIKNNSDRRPSIYNLRGSSQIIDNLDILMLLYNANIHHDLLKLKPELKNVIDITFGKVRGNKMPEPIDLQFNDCGFKEKELSTMQTNVMNGSITINLDGEIEDEQW